MASSIVVDAPSEEARAAREALDRSRIRCGHMTQVGGLILYSLEPPGYDLLNQWTVRPVTSFCTVPAFVTAVDRLTVAQRCSNVKLMRRGTKGAVYNVFARVEAGVPLADAHQAAGDAMAEYLRLCAEEQLDEREAYKAVVRQFHEAVYNGYNLPRRGAKYRPLAGLACAADLLTASDTEIEVDDVDVTMSGVPSDIIFDLNKDGTVYVDMAPSAAIQELSTDEFRHVQDIRAVLGKGSGHNPKGATGGKGGRGKGKAPTRVSPRKRVAPGATPAASAAPPGPAQSTSGTGGAGGAGGGRPPPKKPNMDKEPSKSSSSSSSSSSTSGSPVVVRRSARQRAAAENARLLQEEAAAAPPAIVDAGEDDQAHPPYIPTPEEVAAAKEAEEEDRRAQEEADLQLQQEQQEKSRKEQASLAEIAKKAQEKAEEEARKAEAMAKRAREVASIAARQATVEASRAASTSTATPTPGGSGTAKARLASPPGVTSSSAPDSDDDFVDDPTPSQGPKRRGKKTHVDEADKCSDTNCRHPLASRTELLQSIRNPELHALAWFFEQHFRSLKAKVEKHGKVIGDIRSAQLRSETVEKEHLEYAKSAAAQKKRADITASDKKNLQIPWQSGAKIVEVLSNPDNVAQLRRFFCVGAPQTKTDFMDIMKELLTLNYHTHVLLDVQPHQTEYILGLEFYGFPRQLKELVKEHLKKEPISCDEHEANQKVINHFNELRKLTFKLQRLKCCYYERRDEVCRLLLVEAEEKLSVIKQVAPVEPGAAGKAEFVARWKGPLEAAYEHKRGKPLDWTERSPGAIARDMADLNKKLLKHKKKMGEYNYDLTLLGTSQPLPPEQSP